MLCPIGEAAIQSYLRQVEDVCRSPDKELPGVLSHLPADWSWQQAWGRMSSVPNLLETIDTPLLLLISIVALPQLLVATAACARLAFASAV